jgi:hypothetical protein
LQSKILEMKNQDGEETRSHGRFIRRRLPSIAVFAIPTAACGAGLA